MYYYSGSFNVLHIRDEPWGVCNLLLQVRESKGLCQWEKKVGVKENKRLTRRVSDRADQRVHRFGELTTHCTECLYCNGYFPTNLYVLNILLMRTRDSTLAAVPRRKCCYVILKHTKKMHTWCLNCSTLAIHTMLRLNVWTHWWASMLPKQSVQWESQPGGQEQS